MELIDAIKWLLSTSWDFFTEVEVPGLGCSFAALFVGLFLAELGLKFVFMMLGMNVAGPVMSLLSRKDKK